MAAERWQQWMPFHIDRFRGSLHVQAMPAAARAGYVYLLAAAWQSQDCTLPGDSEELQILSGLNAEDWARHETLLLRRFSKRDDGRLQNDALAAEWNDARSRFENNRSQRANAGKAGAEKRWQKDSGRHSEAMATDSGSHTETMAKHSNRNITEQEHNKKTTTSAAASATHPPAVIGLTLVSGEMHLVTAHRLTELQGSFPALDVMAQLRAMREWLVANPRNRKTASGIERFIVNWLSREQNSARVQPNAPRAQVGVAKPPSAEKTREMLAREEQDKQDILAYWRKVRGSQLYLRDAPRWVREVIDKEQNQEQAVA